MVLDLLVGIPALRTISSEKGTLTAPAQTWPQGSLFSLIDRSLTDTTAPKLFGEHFEALVCDDLGTESADFIGVDSSGNRRVVFLAAKWKAGVPGAGASDIYDFCGQALKTIAYLKADGMPLPGAPGKFDQNWSLRGGSVARTRKGPRSRVFRALFQSIRTNPNARREIWLVLSGGIISRSAVETGFRSTAPAPHTLQLFHLLLSVYASCQSIGVDLKIYCSD
jgi:hypothetical protein